MDYFNNCKFSKHEYCSPDDGVTAPKYVGAIKEDQQMH
jgi:hypothetical protein